jgi:uncharacterized protein YjaZ
MAIFFLAGLNRWAGYATEYYISDRRTATTTTTTTTTTSSTAKRAKETASSPHGHLTLTNLFCYRQSTQYVTQCPRN